MSQATLYAPLLERQFQRRLTSEMSSVSWMLRFQLRDENSTTHADLDFTNLVLRSSEGYICTNYRLPPA
ncbi:hypothetical protein HPP92_012295 [Vanilla planifolia]|uniref:Uncharacterized protein n=1 Tax=Vanilla planifolia TaxID=51239 RepID=A0A835R8Q4_VANPL|nr:hypothetical protein HPP92_012295 [Vanilla planifolia]